MEKSIWIMSFKVRVLQSSPLAMDDSEYAQAEAATYASSRDDAQAQLLQQLDGAKLELTQCFHISAIESAKWVSESEFRDDILELVEEVKFSKNFGFGIFRDPDGMEE